MGGQFKLCNEGASWNRRRECMRGSVAPDPDSNLNCSLISIPDSGKLGSGKILCYQALDLIQVADLIQVKKT